MKPILRKVKHFLIRKECEIDCLTLSVWILLMPNLQILDISQLNCFDKGYLIDRLRQMIENDQRLHKYCNQIEQLIIFSNVDRFQPKKREEMLENCQKIFINAVIQ